MKKQRRGLPFKHHHRKTAVVEANQSVSQMCLTAFEEKTPSWKADSALVRLLNHD